MGIADFFRPKYRHSDIKVRTEAVRALTSDDAAILAQIARTDRDPAVRRIAIEKLDEAEVLADIAKADDERTLRDLAGERAAELWVQIACDEDDEVAAAAALEGLLGLDDHVALAGVIVRSTSVEIRRKAFAVLREPRALVELARTSTDAAMRLEAVARLDEVAALRALAIDVAAKEVGIAAVDRLDDDAALEQVAQKAKSKQVRQRARKKLTDREEAARKARPQVSDDIKRRRAEKTQLLRRMEGFAETFEWEQIDPEVHETEAEWLGVGDAQDPVLEDKFAKLLERYQTRRTVHFQKLDEARAQQQARRDENRPPVPRPESARERDREEEPEIEVVAPNAAPDPAREARMAEAAARREERDRRRAEDEAKKAQEVLDRESRKAEAIERGKQIAISLEALCADLEGMADSTEQRAVMRLLDQASKAFEQVGKVAPDQRGVLEERYRAARAKLVIKTQELREAEDWQRWANMPRQEALIKEAEALAAAEAPTLPALQDLQKRWKNVGPVPQNKSKEMWEKFKAAADAAFAKIRGVRDEEKAKWGENATAREALIAEAEQLAASTDWDVTAERLKAMQAEWKALGPVPRKQGDVLWKQFRAACDRFFEARKPVLDARQGELLDNLAAKERLCAKIEALVEAAPGEAGWGAAIGAVKAAQRDWRDIGFVPRRDADAIYARFRAACDALFAKRDEARDAEAEAERAEVIALRGEIEAAIAAPEGGGATAIAVQGKLRALAERDLRPDGELQALYEQMVRHVIETDAAGLRGSELDPEAAQRRRDKLVARAEDMLPKGAPAVAASEGPEDVAAKLRAALKSNALGGVRWDRDPRELIDELRGEWAAIGPVIGAAAEAAKLRFEEACAKVVAAAGGERAREERGERDDRGGREDRGERRDRPRRERRPRAVDARPAPEASPAPVVVAGPEDATAPAKIAAMIPPAAAPEPAPIPPKLPDPLPPPAVAAPRARSISTPPPADPVDDSWGDDLPAVDAAADAVATPAAEPAPPAGAQGPAASEMAGDGATEGDGIDAGWD